MALRACPLLMLTRTRFKHMNNYHYPIWCAARLQLSCVLRGGGRFTVLDRDTSAVLPAVPVLRLGRAAHHPQLQPISVLGAPFCSDSF